MKQQKQVQKSPKSRIFINLEKLSYTQARLEYRLNNLKEYSDEMMDDLDSAIQQIILELYTAKTLKMHVENDDGIYSKMPNSAEYISTMINIYKKYDRHKLLD